MHARFLDAVARIKKCEDKLKGTTRELQSALKQNVGFLNIRREL
jgi:hypothetical protein